jgi:hypothetical protein
VFIPYLVSILKKGLRTLLEQLQISMDSLSELPVVSIEPDPQTRRRKIHCKQELIVNSLQRFYSGCDDKAEVLKLLEGTSDISLRLIDWFVTNYSKQHNISYILNGQEFLVYTNYKSQLKAYSKKLFDPFCRRERILFQIQGFPMFQTTVGKLNFFRWAIEKGVLTYIKLNFSKIESAMNINAREVQKVRKAASESSTNTTTTVATRGVTRKRIPTGISPISTIMQKHEYDVEIRFD